MFKIKQFFKEKCFFFKGWYLSNIPLKIQGINCESFKIVKHRISMGFLFLMNIPIIVFW